MNRPKDENNQHSQVDPDVDSPSENVDMNETSGEQKDLPFVMGTLGDLSGKPSDPLPPLMNRRFIDIDRDNFDRVLRGQRPRLSFKVKNTLTYDGTKLGVELHFDRMDDFEPEQVVKQVEPLRKLLEVRQQLFELLAKSSGNDRLTEKLQQILSDTHLLEKLKEEVGVETETDIEPERER